MEMNEIPRQETRYFANNQPVGIRQLQLMLNQNDFPNFITVKRWDGTFDKYTRIGQGRGYTVQKGYIDQNGEERIPHAMGQAMVDIVYELFGRGVVGGARRKGSRKGSRKSRKSRKGSRKSRKSHKASRKSRR